MGNCPRYGQTCCSGALSLSSFPTSLIPILAPPLLKLFDRSRDFEQYYYVNLSLGHLREEFNSVGRSECMTFIPFSLKGPQIRLHYGLAKGEDSIDCLKLIIPLP